MRVIFIGAGRGQRLMPTTAEVPKCFAEVRGTSILDWTLEAFRKNGLDDICFIGGYRIEKVRERYPHFTFRHNTDWPNNNILASLMHAEDLMDEPFICCYSDILFNADVVRRALASDEDFSLVVDTLWTERYTHRTEHPPDDAEKVIVEDGVVTQIDRDIEPGAAHGEYIGMAKFSSAGAALLRDHYHRCRLHYAGRSFRQAKSFEKAFLIQLLQEMIEAEVRMVSVDTPGQYMEIDTQQDFDLARMYWKENSS